MSYDNITALLIAFRNFENAMNDPNFVANIPNKVALLRENVDCYEIGKM